MSDTSDGSTPQVQIATVYRDASGRLVAVDILPEPEGIEDKVLVWDASTQRPKWMDPADLGFTALPMILDVPVTDGSGAFITDGSGAVVLSNVPYRSLPA